MGNNQNYRNVIFKTSIGGYKKSTVNDYIESENRRFAELEASYNNTIDSLKRMLDNAEREIGRLHGIEENLTGTIAELNRVNSENAQLRDDAKSSADEYESLLSEKDDRIKVVEAALDAKNEEIALLSRRVDSISAELEEKITSVNELTEQNAALRNSAENTKADARDRVDTESNETAELIGRAKAASEDMLKRAEESAGIILERAHKEALDYREEIFVAAKEVFDAATDELRRSINFCMSDFISGIKYAKGNAERTRNATAICRDDLSRRIERMQSDLDRAIAEKLAQFRNRRK